jgi:hypothetical protein
LAGWRRHWPSTFICQEVYWSIGIPDVEEHKFKIYQQGIEEKYAFMIINLSRTGGSLVLTCNGLQAPWPASPELLEDLYRRLTVELIAQIESDEDG